MRIIDKNTDFYDYYQNIYRDDHLTFDRRDSYILTKKEIADSIYVDQLFKRLPPHLLLQINHTFWLFQINILEINEWGRCLDYSLDLIHIWKDYDINSEMIKLSFIKFPWYCKKIEDYIAAIKNNEQKTYKIFNKFNLYKDNVREERHIPILRETGIASFVDANEIYLALEEYFSEQKTREERTEPLGATNEDKITAHGFDTVTSFRGKN